jgi:cytochrome c-type biogenesis protein CcmH
MAGSSRPGLPAPPAAPARPQSRAAASADAGTIHGRVELGPGLAGSLPEQATLFVIARNAGARGGPPLAVRRIASPELPLDFEIGPQHAMIQGMPFAGEIQLTVRLDGDGDAMTRRAGDLAGQAPAPVAPGTRGVTIVLDEQL